MEKGMSYMTLTDKILTHWNVPIKVIAWQKLVLENRNLLEKLHLSVWEETILGVSDLTPEEQHLLQVVIQSIDESVEQFEIAALFSLISETTARYTEDRFVLLKYGNAVTFGDLWNNWYRSTRGVIIDLENVELVTYNLPKFFNLFEKPDTELPIVLDRMNQGVVTQYVKEDGSNVSVSFYDDHIFVNTPGDFTSSQAIFSRELLTRDHSDFLLSLKQEYADYTFVFEYVSPFNQIVVQYVKEELILLHILDKRNGSILSVQEVQQISKDFNFRPCQTVTEDLMTLIEDSKDPEKYPAQEQEGWVVRIDHNDDVFFLKLKCSDYANMHRIIAQALNPRWILEAIMDESIDDKISLIESEEIRNLVSKMIHIFYEWNENKKQELQQEYAIFPDHLWIDDDMIERYLTYSNFVSEYMVSDAAESYKQRVRAFLESFSKGKGKNPKEELLVIAQSIAEQVKDDFTWLSEYEYGYKLKTSSWLDRFIKSLNSAIESYAQGNEVDEAFLPFLDKHFSEFKSYIRSDWEEIFKSNKDEFSKLRQSNRENLKPHLFDMHDYARKRYLFLTLQKELVLSIKRNISQYFFRNAEVEYLELYSMFDHNLVINDETFVFYQQLKQFENEGFLSHIPSDSHLAPDQINTTLKEVMAILRGNETDNSYTVAKEIFSKIPTEFHDQTAYYKARGQFSAHVNQKVANVFKPVFFELFTTLSENRNNKLNEFSFYHLIEVVTDPSDEPLSDNQLDFREIQRHLNQKNANE